MWTKLRLCFLPLFMLSFNQLYSYTYRVCYNNYSFVIVYIHPLGYTFNSRKSNTKFPKGEHCLFTLFPKIRSSIRANNSKPTFNFSSNGNLSGPPLNQLLNQVTSIKMDRTNFHLWQNLAWPILRSYQIKSYLTGKSLP